MTKNTVSTKTTKKPVAKTVKTAKPTLKGSGKDAKSTAKKPVAKKKVAVSKPEPFVHKSTVESINEAIASNNGKMPMKLLRVIIDSYHAHAADMVAQHGHYSMRGLVKLKAAHVKPLPKREGKKPGTNEVVMLPARKEGYKGKAVALMTLKEAALKYAKSQGCKMSK